MEFKVRKEVILDTLTKVQGITAKRTNILITSNVLISAAGSEIALQATDLEMAFKAQYEAEVLQEGSTAVPSRKLYEIIRAFPSENVSVKEIENKWIRIEDKKIEYNIVGMETTDFPRFPDIEQVEFLDLPADVLRKMINKTIYSVLADEGRAQLSGICFETISAEEGKKIRMVSTDGHRLSKADHLLEDDQAVETGKRLIIPKTGIVELLRIIEGEDRVQIGARKSNFIVKSDGEVFVTKLIEGDFPDYEMVIPKMSGHTMTVNKDGFAMMLRRMSILASEKYPGVKLKIGKEELEASVTNPEIGESKETIEVSYSGEPIEVAFNPKYFMETVRNMESEDLIVRFKDEVNPCTLEGKGDPGFLSVIMPMRV